MHKTPEITRLIHENFWVVLSFALAQPRFGQILADDFQGEWKYLRKSVYELAVIRADRALLEMGTQLRVLDDDQCLGEYLKRTEAESLGSVIQADGAKEPLYLRDMTNKIMHAAEFKWELSDPNDPRVICRPRDEDRWQMADINLIAVAALIGELMF